MTGTDNLSENTEKEKKNEKMFIIICHQRNAK